jgi:predicted methyltransferase
LNYRIKVLGFFIFALAVFAGLSVSYSAINTLSRLDVVEAERDEWQKPSDVIAALELEPQSEVADLGCGSGYFTLKLSRLVANHGHVIAEDIRWLSLTFLWFRTVLKGEHNVSIVHGEPLNPRLPLGRVNAVLISNTYHEFTDSRAILSHVRQSLISGGKLVVLDRAPKPENVGVTETGEHEISADQVGKELVDAGFEIVSRQDHFVEKDPDSETWWLLVARKP